MVSSWKTNGWTEAVARVDARGHHRQTYYTVTSIPMKTVLRHFPCQWNVIYFRAGYSSWHDKLEWFPPLFSKRRVKSAVFFSFSLSLPLNEGTTGKMDAVDVTRRKLGRIDTTIIHALRRLLCNRCARNRAIILELNAIIHESRTKYYGKYYAITPCTRALAQAACEMGIRRLRRRGEFRGKNRLRNARTAPLCLITLTSSADSLASTVDLNLKRDETCIRVTFA